MAGNRYKIPPAVSGKTGYFLLAAVAMAAAALVVRKKAADAEAENPPLGQFIEVDGVRLHYLEQGSGPPIVLLHGNGTMVEDFTLSGVVEALAKGHRVIAFDRPGFGHSDRPEGRIWDQGAQAELIHAALQKLGVEKPIVVGHSWGTMVATALALAHPESVERLVLMSGYYYPTPRLDLPALAMPAVPGIGTVLRNTISPLLARAMWPLIRRTMFGPAPVTESFLRWPVWMTLRPSQLRASAAETAMMVPGAWKRSDDYSMLKMPVTILAGDGDKIVNTHVQSERLHRDVPQSELRVIPGAGHMVHHIAPSEVIAAIAAAADGVPPRAGAATQAAAPA